MSCICCSKRVAVFHFRCDDLHEAMCKHCATNYIKNNIKHLFQSKNNMNCLRCFKSCGQHKRIFNDFNLIGYMDFGLKTAVEDNCLVNDLLTEYLFSFVVDLDDEIWIPKKQKENTLKYWGGFKHLLKSALEQNPPPNVLKAIENLLK